MTMLSFNAAAGYKRCQQTRRDAFVAALRDMSPDEIDAWIDTHSANPLQQRRLLKALTKVVALLVRRELG